MAFNFKDFLKRVRKLPTKQTGFIGPVRTKEAGGSEFEQSISKQRSASKLEGITEAIKKQSPLTNLNQRFSTSFNTVAQSRIKKHTEGIDTFVKTTGRGFRDAIASFKSMPYFAGMKSTVGDKTDVGSQQFSFGMVETVLGRDRADAMAHTDLDEEEKLQVINGIRKQEFSGFKQKYDKTKQQQAKWEEAHPEYQPKTEWKDKGVIEALQVRDEDGKMEGWDFTAFQDPSYWSYHFGNSVAFMTSYAATYAATAVVTRGNLPVAATVATLVTLPQISDDLYNDLVANGATPEEATPITQKLAPVIASVELLGGAPVMGMLNKMFFKSIQKKAVKEISKLAARKILLQGGKNMAAIIGAEVLEEEIQGILQNIAVGVFNENRKWFDNMAETAAATIVAMGPLGFFGGGASIKQQAKEQGVTTEELLKEIIPTYFEGIEQGKQEAGAKPVTDTIKQMGAGFDPFRAIGMMTGRLDEYNLGKGEIKGAEVNIKGRGEAFTIINVDKDLKQFTVKSEKFDGDTISVPFDDITNIVGGHIIKGKVPEGQDVVWGDPQTGIKITVDRTGGTKYMGSGVDPIRELGKIAGRFKTSQEFVEAQPDKIYHATDVEFDEFRPSLDPDEEAFWFTRNKSTVESAEYPIVMERFIKKGGKLISEEDYSKLEDTDEFLDFDGNVGDFLESKGFVGIESGDGVLQLFNPNEDLLSKAQLTDIWNKAHSGTKLMNSGLDPLREAGKQVGRKTITEQIKAQGKNRTVTEAIQGEKFLGGVRKDVKKEITKKRFSQAQKAKQQERAEAKGEKVGEKTGRQLMSGFKKDIREQKKEVKEIQDNILAQAEALLPLRERGKLLRSLRNAKSYEDLATATDRIEELKFKGEIRDLKAKIKDELKKTKVKKVSGKPVGEYTPEIQVILDKMREAVKLTKANAEDKIIANVDKYKENMPVEVAFENRILDMVAGVEEMGVTELDEVLKQIRSVKSEGKTLHDLKAFNLTGENQRLQEMAVDVITGGKGLPAGLETTGVEERIPDTVKGKVDKIVQKLGKFSLDAYRQVLDTLSFNDKSKPYQSRLSVWADVKDTENKKKELMEQVRDRLTFIYKDAFGIKNDKDVMKQMREDHGEQIDMGEFVNSKGETVSLVYTKAEMRKVYMESLDPSLTSTFTEGKSFTEEMRQAIETFLTENDKVFVEKQFKYYQWVYEQVNPVYQRLYGINLPLNKFYSPIRRRGFDYDSLGGFGEFVDEVHYRNSIAPKATVSRVRNVLPLEKQSDIQTLMSHSEEMMHFVAWAEKLRSLRSTFDNNSVKNAMKIEFGTELIDALNLQLGSFTSQGLEMGRNLRWLDNIRVNFVTSVLAKPSIGVKQLFSLPAFAEDVPTHNFIAGVMDFFKNPTKHSQFLHESSTLIRTRGENMTRDIKDTANSQEFKQFVKKPNFKNAIMLFTKLGDKWAILPGAWSEYRYLTEIKKQTHEQAINKIEQSIADAQQSGDISQLSTLQKGNSIWKLMTMFMNSPIQYTRKVLGAVRNQTAGRQSIDKTAKIIFIYWVLLPVLFQWASDFFRTDEDEWDNLSRAALLGPINGVVYFGDVTVAMVRAAFGQQVYDSEIPIYGVKDVAVRLVTKIRKLIVDADDISFEETMEMIMEAGETAGDLAGKVTGYPIQYIQNINKGFQDVMAGDFRNGFGQMLGWSEHAIGTEETSPKSKYNEYYKKLNDGDITEAGKKKLQENMAQAFEDGEIDASDIKRTKTKLLAFDKYTKFKNVSKKALDAYYDNDRYDKDVKKEVKRFFQKEQEAKAKKGELPQWKEGEELSRSNFLKVVGIYANALTIDPITAFDRITTGQNIRKVNKGTIVVQRKDRYEEGGSLDIREKLGATELQEADHIIAIHLGGSGTDMDNIMLLTIEEHKVKTRVDRYLIKLLTDGKITKQKAQELVRKFVDGDLTEEEVKSQAGK